MVSSDESIVSVGENGILTGAVDPSGAYEWVENWTRSFELTENELVVRDHIELDAPRTVTWMLHTLSQPQAKEGCVTVMRNGWQLDILPEDGGLGNLIVEDRFAVDLNEGVPEAYQVTMPQQYHLKWTTEKLQTHDICVHFKVSKA